MTSGIATAVPREMDLVTASAAVKALETPPERGGRRGMLDEGREVTGCKVDWELVCVV